MNFPQASARKNWRNPYIEKRATHGNTSATHGNISAKFGNISAKPPQTTSATLIINRTHRLRPSFLNLSCDSP